MGLIERIKSNPMKQFLEFSDKPFIETEIVLDEIQKTKLEILGRLNAEIDNYNGEYKCLCGFVDAMNLAIEIIQSKIGGCDVK